MPRRKPEEIKPELYWGKEWSLDSYSEKPRKMLYLIVGEEIIGLGRDVNELPGDLLFWTRHYLENKEQEVINVNCMGDETKRIIYVDGYWGRLPVPAHAILFRRLWRNERAELQRNMDRLARKDKRTRVQLVA